MVQVEVKVTINAQKISLRRADGRLFDINFLVATKGYLNPKNPIYKALGCRRCRRIQAEAADQTKTYKRRRTVAQVLGCDNSRARPFADNYANNDRTELAQTCELLDDGMVSPELRKIEPPCKRKKKITISF